jgi:molecular chaperone DnaJ
MEKKDFYQVLGVSPTASPEELKKTYRRLAKQFHPDRRPGDKQAEERFKEISQAYDTLGDPAKRKQYDQMKAAFSQGFRPEGGFDFGGMDFDLGDIFSQAGRRGGQRSRPGGRRGFEDIFGLGGLGDLFSQFADQGSRFRQSRAGPQKGQDIATDLKISFDHAVKGGKARFTVRREEACVSCGGSGAAPGTRPVPCTQCGGRGMITIVQGGFGVSRPCPRCMGKGMAIKQACPACRGSGSAPATKTVSLRIPAGIADGDSLRARGMGEPGVAGGPPGDLIVAVHAGASPHFTRRGSDLYVRAALAASAAAAGGKLKVRTLTGEAALKIPAGTKSGSIFKLKGQGVPRMGGKGRGDLYVTAVISGK